MADISLFERKGTAKIEGFDLHKIKVGSKLIVIIGNKSKKYIVRRRGFKKDTIYLKGK